MNFDFLVSILFPRSCLVCRKSLRAGVLCEACRRTITLHRTLFYGQCGAARPPFPYLLGAAGNYENRALKTLIHALKFRGVKAAAEPLADLIEEYILSLKINLDGHIVMPVPLSPKRFRARGFNQSECIARRLAERLGLRLETKRLVRTKHAKPQSETESVEERRNNIRGCFAVAGAGVGAGTVNGKNIVLIDDVTTSGATFFGAAQVLRAAGAAKIFALAAARAGLRHGPKAPGNA